MPQSKPPCEVHGRPLTTIVRLPNLSATVNYRPVDVGGRGRHSLSLSLYLFSLSSVFANCRMDFFAVELYFMGNLNYDILFNIYREHWENVCSHNLWYQFENRLMPMALQILKQMI